MHTLKILTSPFLHNGPRAFLCTKKGGNSKPGKPEKCEKENPQPDKEFTKVGKPEIAQKKICPILYAEKHDFQIFSMTKAKLPGALELLREQFVREESACKAINIYGSPDALKDVEEIAKEISKDGISLVVVDKENGKVEGFAFNKIILKPQENKSLFKTWEEKCKHPASKALMNYMAEVEASYDIFNHFNAAVSPIFLGLSQRPKNKRIGALLYELSSNTVRRMNRCEDFRIPATDESLAEVEVLPEVFMAIMSCGKGQRIAKMLGYKTVSTISFEKFKIGEKTFANVLKEKEPTVTCEIFVPN